MGSVAKNTGSRARLPAFKSHLFYFVAVTFALLFKPFMSQFTYCEGENSTSIT